jgi:hypothetical protein
MIQKTEQKQEWAVASFALIDPNTDSNIHDEQQNFHLLTWNQKSPPPTRRAWIAPCERLRDTGGTGTCIPLP